jgi:hypothetical protein
MSVQEINPNISEHPRYLIPEHTYGYDHPDVIFWTKHFMEQANKRNVFTNINATININSSLTAAETMAKAWYIFSCYVPSFITKAVAQTNDPERQHHLIQIAYDELGGKDKNYIHSKLFLEAIEQVKIELAHDTSLHHIEETLNTLNETLANTKSQHGIVGLLLSFEIIAEENIETLFKGLCYDESCENLLSNTPFFKIHRTDESEHIRHSVANYLRFCKTQQAADEFQHSFDKGVDFWQRFWDQCARLITIETDLYKCN